MTLALDFSATLAGVMVWGWVRWSKRSQPKTLLPVLSLVGFALATASGLLAISITLYMQAVGGLPYYDPTLLRFYRWGALLSATGIVFAIFGVWRPSPLRWHAPLSAA